MVVIRITTVGYGETQPLPRVGRLFAILLMLVGIVSFGFIVPRLRNPLLKESRVAKPS